MATPPNPSKKKKKAAKESKGEGPTISMAEENPKSNIENQKDDGKDVEEKKMKKKTKRTNEIDDIFQGIKAKKLKEAAAGEEDKKLKVKKKGDGKKVKGITAGEGHEIGNARRRKTADGLSIYSAEELGFGNSNAGGTPLCPFDCQCCF